MTKEGKIILTVGILLYVGLIGAILFIKTGTVNSFGSVQRANEYQATTTTALGFAGRQVTLISNTQGAFGSVIVASSSPAGTISFKDATSTTDVASTTLASFPITPTAGTYTFDAVVLRGLIVETQTGFAGNYTITYR